MINSSIKKLYKKTQKFSKIYSIFSLLYVFLTKSLYYKSIENYKYLLLECLSDLLLLKNLEPLNLNLNILNIKRSNITDDEIREVKHPKISEINTQINNSIDNEKSERIKQIENWFKDDLIDDKQKEELINSGKDFSRKELIVWMRNRDREEFLANEAKNLNESTKLDNEKRLKDKVLEWLDSIESKDDNNLSGNNNVEESNSRPISEWSPSNSDGGPSSIPKINLNIDQVEGFDKIESFNYDLFYIVTPEIYFIYFLLFMVIGGLIYKMTLINKEKK